MSLIDWNIKPKHNSWVWIDEQGETITSNQEIYTYSSHLAYHIKNVLLLPEKSVVLLIFDPGYAFLVAFLACILSKTIPVCIPPDNIFKLKKIIADCEPQYTFVSQSIGNVIANKLDCIFNIADIEERFNTCIKFIRDFRRIIKLNTQETLSLYSYYKQATVGNINVTKPSRIKRTDYKKYTSWDSLNGTPTNDAKENYCKLIQTLIVNKGINRNIIIPTRYESISLDDFDNNLNSHAPVRFSESDICFIQYSSGSTNDPKGVTITHRNISANIRYICKLSRERHGAEPWAYLNWLPHYHDMGLVGGYLGAYIYGSHSSSSNQVLYSMSPQYFIQNIKYIMSDMLPSKQITSMCCPNFALKYIYDNCPLDTNMSSLKFVTCGAEKIIAQDVDNFVHKFGMFNPNSFIFAYGLAENTLITTHADYNIERVDNTISVGKPITGTEVIVVNPRTRKICKELETGLLFLRGKSLTSGYYRKSDHSSFRNIINGKLYYDTGDLAFVKNNNIYINGRDSEKIIIQGKNFYPEDIESALSNINCIIKGGVSAFGCQIGETEKLMILFEVDPENPPTFSAIRANIYRTFGISVYNVIYVPIGSLQKTTSGKSKRCLNKQKWLNNEFNIINQSMDCHNSIDNSYLDREIVTDLEFIFNVYDYKENKLVPLIDLGIDSITFSKIIQTIRLKSPTNINIDFQKCYELTYEEFYNLLLYLYDKSTYLDPKLLKHSDIPLQNLMNQDRVISREELPGYGRLGTGLAHDPEHVFLTGVTGYLGSYLLIELLNRTSSTIHCIVRAQDKKHALNRILSSLVNNSISIAPEVIQARCVIYAGDLTLERFGLEDDDYHFLERNIDTVLHSACNVNYILTYSQLKDNNVNATRRIIHFCFSKVRKELQYISTALIFGFTAKKLLEEHDNNDECQDLAFGYAHTKWVAEHLVLNASNFGLPVKIYRLPFCTSTIATGAYHENDIMIKVIKFCLKYRVGLDGNNNVNMVTIDDAAYNIISMALTDDFYGKSFHITSSYTDPVNTLYEIISNEIPFYQFKMLKETDFVDYINQYASDEDTIYSILPFINEHKGISTKMAGKFYSNTVTKTYFQKYNLEFRDRSLSDIVKAILYYLRKKRFILE